MEDGRVHNSAGGLEHSDSFMIDIPLGECREYELMLREKAGDE